MSDEEKTIKLQFAPEQKSPTLEFGHGEYSRKFDAKDQPFDCDEEEAALLLGTGYFVAAKETRPETVAGPRSSVAPPGKIGGAPGAPLEPGQ